MKFIQYFLEIFRITLIAVSPKAKQKNIIRHYCQYKLVTIYTNSVSQSVMHVYTQIHNMQHAAPQGSFIYDVVRNSVGLAYTSVI